MLGLLALSEGTFTQDGCLLPAWFSGDPPWPRPTQHRACPGRGEVRVAAGSWHSGAGSRPVLSLSVSLGDKPAALFLDLTPARVGGVSHQAAGGAEASQKLSVSITAPSPRPPRSKDPSAPRGWGDRGCHSMGGPCGRTPSCVFLSPWVLGPELGSACRPRGSWVLGPSKVRFLQWREKGRPGHSGVCMWGAGVGSAALGCLWRLLDCSWS